MIMKFSAKRSRPVNHSNTKTSETGTTTSALKQDPNTQKAKKRTLFITGVRCQQNSKHWTPKQHSQKQQPKADKYMYLIFYCLTVALQLEKGAYQKFRMLCFLII